jgi:nitrogenase molybdenum-iron protein alpha chain
MRSVAKNPLLPKRTVRWIKGPFAEKRPETRDSPDKPPAPAAKPLGSSSSAGRLSPTETRSQGFGANLDMLALSHGAVGCGAARQLTRLNMPGFVQGIESFTALHASTNLVSDDLADAGDMKLARALDEAMALFPLASGIAIQDDCMIGWLDPSVQAIAKEKRKASGKLIVAEGFGLQESWVASSLSALSIARRSRKPPAPSPYDVALTQLGPAPGHVWVAAKLLREIGLNPIPVFGASASDMARVADCKLVLGGVLAVHLHELKGIPRVRLRLASPNTTDESLRCIAAQFDETIQANAERVIAESRKKVDAIIAQYKPRFARKLFFNFNVFDGEYAVESLRMLGFRIGDNHGWPSFSGIPHTHRHVDRPYEYGKVHAETIAEAKPDLVFDGSDFDDFYWHKRGQTALPFSPLFDRCVPGFWGYDGFASLAVTLDRHINAPWRKLVKPPWPNNSG